jgi:DNA-binding transcriptional regulator YiaG
MTKGTRDFIHMPPSAFRAWRQSLDWTQKMAAAALGVSLRAIGLWEVGECPIPGMVELAIEAIGDKPDGLQGTAAHARARAVERPTRRYLHRDHG